MPRRHMSGMFDWFKKQKKAEKGLQPREPEAQLPSIFDPFKPNLPASVEPSDPFRSALPARPQPPRPIIPARREEPPAYPLEQILQPPPPPPPEYRPPARPEPAAPRLPVPKASMIFPPLPFSLNPDVMPDALVFPPFTSVLGKRIATQKEYDDQVDKLNDLCEAGDEAACEKIAMDEAANEFVFEEANDMAGEIMKHWPVKEIFKETRDRLKASLLVDGQPVRIGRIMDIDPSRNLEEQMAELLFMEPKKLTPFIQKWPTEEIWDQLLYPHLYTVEWAMRRAGQPEDFPEGAYSLDWSPDHKGVDIMYTPARAF